MLAVFARQLADCFADRQRPRDSAGRQAASDRQFAHYRTDYNETMLGAIARLRGEVWVRRMRPRLNRLRDQLLPPPGRRRPAAPVEAGEYARQMTAEWCRQHDWLLEQLQTIRRGWTIARREELDFQTLMPRGLAGRGWHPLTGPRPPRVAIAPYGTGVGIAAPLREFLCRLRGEATDRASSAPSPVAAALGHYSVNNYSCTHASGDVSGFGLSVDIDLHTVDRLDPEHRGFYPYQSAMAMLRAIDASARSIGADWRVLYNDFTVAHDFNRESNYRHVGFEASTTFRREAATGRQHGQRPAAPAAPPTPAGINWHGPLILHYHLDLFPAETTPMSCQDPGQAPSTECAAQPAHR